MTQTLAPQTTLYERDLNLWLENAIAQLKSGDLQNLDIENLIEELEGLAGRDKRELKSRLTTLLEHSNSKFGENPRTRGISGFQNTAIVGSYYKISHLIQRALWF